jgi:hypothetical protein
VSALSRVLIFKILATLLCWSAPLILLPASAIEAIGFPPQQTYMFVRLLGWAYLSLCVGYGFALRSALAGKRALGPIWVVSNGGAFAYLLFYGLMGTWNTWGGAVQLIAWGSVVATFFITLGLIIYGVRGEGAAT